VTYVLHIAVLWTFAASLAVSLDLVVGRLGILSLCHSAFYATGAYTTALLLTRAGVPWAVAVGLSPVAAALLSLPLASVSRRLRHDALVLATLAVLLVLIELARNLRGLTGGLDGISGIPPLSFGPLRVRHELPWVGVGLLQLALALGVVSRIGASPLGRALCAYRDDPTVAATLGVRPWYATGHAFALSAGLAGLTGGLYATYASYIGPALFGFDASVLMLAMVVVGGAGTTWGPPLGALALVLVPEAARAIGFSSAAVGAFQQILFALALLTFVLWRPRGLLGGYRFR